MPKVPRGPGNKNKDKNSPMPDGEAWGMAAQQMQGKGVLPKNNKRSGGRKFAPNDPRSVMLTKKEKAYKK